MLLIKMKSVLFTTNSPHFHIKISAPMIINQSVRKMPVDALCPHPQFFSHVGVFPGLDRGSNHRPLDLKSCTLPDYAP